MIERLRAHLAAENPGGVLGLYLFGSWVIGGLRPDSDIDLMLITRRSLTERERRGLTELLLQCSGRRASVAPGRPVELAAVVLGDVGKSHDDWSDRQGDAQSTADHLAAWIRDQASR